ncbi:heavy metal translocating P-type ATPase metal-binding domain-containing protein [Coraliomargarita sp. SDUM461004]|uniref:Heavy metal translocating P-type ATPase metal-binding domain-containing protein n=1 Tax=Thalassobacterium sedimentorum TaxID=3041258 RepID=A0ABU1AJ82_9BACT|nr:heavy metal translocating P-type ATPase metal-binding domain-containing protein [Coraliomargarita sp. SDUM461004]MDQ8194877.1 heavy metal translocating P-type ATPase metal-binding domain-containing protein [Coraliomargarita sp. SDUM461004]
MTERCKHCATPYTESSGVNGFCCAGCEQVYALIRQQGHDDYYRLQDRVAQPLKDRALEEVDLQALERAQVKVEAGASTGHAVFRVEGMSCMGCVWLVERLVRTQTGHLHAEATLSDHSLFIEWRSADFNLPELGEALFKFGYRLDASPRSPDMRPRLSPLALRCMLTLFFACNLLLLSVYEHFMPAAGEEPAALLSLLSLVCVCFTLLLGAAPFVVSVYRATRIRRWHSDWVAVAILVSGIGGSVYQGLCCGMGVTLVCLLISGLVSVLIVARWLSALVAKR